MRSATLAMFLGAVSAVSVESYGQQTYNSYHQVPAYGAGYGAPTYGAPAYGHPAPQPYGHGYAAPQQAYGHGYAAPQHYGGYQAPAYGGYQAPQPHYQPQKDCPGGDCYAEPEYPTYEKYGCGKEDDCDCDETYPEEPEYKAEEYSYKKPYHTYRRKHDRWNPDLTPAPTHNVARQYERLMSIPREHMSINLPRWYSGVPEPEAPAAPAPEAIFYNKKRSYKKLEECSTYEAPCEKTTYGYEAPKPMGYGYKAPRQSYGYGYKAPCDTCEQPKAPTYNWKHPKHATYKPRYPREFRQKVVQEAEPVYEEAVYEGEAVY
jgi:hypothetical protein